MSLRSLKSHEAVAEEDLQAGLTRELSHSASPMMTFFFETEFDECVRTSGHLIQTLCDHDRHGGGLGRIRDVSLVR